MRQVYQYWLEKWQVWITAAAALGLTWFACWHWVSPWDPNGALAFLPGGSYGRLGAFAGVIWAIALGCAALTLSAPPEGALLAVLVGAVGLSLRGGPMRALLWQWQPDQGRLFSLLALEVVALAAILGGAMALIALARRAARQIHAGWVWAEPATEKSGPPSRPTTAQWILGSWFRNILASLRGASRPTQTRVVQALGCLLMELALAVILLVFTFRSTDRGQIAFALAGSFFVAALLADHVFPVRSAVPIWLGPVLMGAAVFALGGAADTGSGTIWRDALIVARGLPLRAALPVDWLAWGGGGAVAGFWISRRLHFAALARKEAEAKKDKA